jgi:hypothetical protein
MCIGGGEKGQGFSIISSALLFLIKKGRAYIGFRV